MHTHILYGVDDGAQEIKDSVELIENALDKGFTEIVLTPHYMPYGDYKPEKESLLERFEILKRVVDKLKLPVKLYLGEEITFEQAVLDLITNSELLSLEDTPYLMIETTRFGSSSELLLLGIKRLKNLGFKIILAHPERYDFVQEDIESLKDFRDLGVILQANYLSLLDNYYRRPTNETLVKMLRADLVDSFGSDAHQKEMYDYIPEVNRIGKSLVGSKRWEELTEINPKKILNDTF